MKSKSWYSPRQLVVLALAGVVRLAKENTSWGYTKIRDVIFTLGHKIGRTTVRRILAEDGIEPAHERRKHMPWATFLKAHWGAIAAMDFFKVEVTTLTGPVRYTPPI